jgi:hypothetical protein
MDTFDGNRETRPVTIVKEHNAEGVESRKQTGAGEAMLQADVDDKVPQENTQIKNPKYRKPEAHLDNPWSHATWKSKARKPEMLKLWKRQAKAPAGSRHIARMLSSA